MAPTDAEDDLDRCRLLGTTALIVQAIMGVLVISSLVLKRQLEKRKRPWRIWLWDVAKQLIGQAVIHGLNLLIALAANSNPCSLYFLNILIDTTLGVIVIFIVLRCATWFFSAHLGYEGFESGEYGQPPRPEFWWKQLIPYIMAIISMKGMVLLPLLLPGISTGLLDFAHNVLEYLSPSIQVIFAMAIFPVIMNIMQFCLVDQFIKANDRRNRDEAVEEAEMEYTRVPDDDVENNVPKALERALHPTGRPMRRSSSVMSFSGRSRDGDWLEDR